MQYQKYKCEVYIYQSLMRHRIQNLQIACTKMLGNDTVNKARTSSIPLYVLQVR